MTASEAILKIRIWRENAVSSFQEKRSKGTIRRISDFMYTPWFIWLEGIGVLALSFLGYNAITFAFLALVAGFALLVSPDALPALPSVMMFTIMKTSTPRTFAWAHASTAIMAAAGTVFSLVAVMHIFFNFKVANLKGNRLWLGYVLLCVTMFTNGFFYDNYDYHNLAAALKLSVYMAGVYFAARAFIRPTRYTLKYYAHICMTYALMIGIFLAKFYLTDKTFIDSGFNKDYLILGQGISNTIGGMLFYGMPFCMYMMCTERKHNWYYFLIASLALVMQLFTYGRGSIVSAVPVYCLCYLLCVICGKNRKQTVICGLVFIAILACAALVFKDHLRKLFSFFLEAGNNDRGRYRLWNEGVIDCFMKHPVFGVGLRYKFRQYFRNYTYFHNTLIQYAAAGGIVGLSAYLFHRMQTVAIFTQRITVNRAFLGLLILGNLIMGIFGTYFMYIEHQIFIAIPLAFADMDLCRSMPFAYAKRGKRYRRLY